MKHTFDKRDAIVLLIIFCAYLGVAGYRISYPSTLMFDEVAFIPQAQQLAHGGEILESTHPPLGKFVAAASIYLLGDNPFSWRLPSLVAGAGILCLVYSLGYALSGTRLPGAFAAFLLSFESLAFVQSRTALYSSPMLFFMLLAILLMVRWREHRGRAALLGAALSFGAGVATRWVALSAIVVIGYLWWGGVFRSRQGLRRSVSDAILFLSVSSALYLGLFVVGPISRGEGILSAISLNVHMFSDHWTNLLTPHRYASPWWTWPLLRRPVWWGFESYPMLALDGSQVVEGIISIGNPVVFAAIPIAVVWGFVKAYREQSLYASVMLLGLFSQWLQWSWVPQNTYMHYFYTVLPHGHVGVEGICDAAHLA